MINRNFANCVESTKKVKKILADLIAENIDSETARKLIINELGLGRFDTPFFNEYGYCHSPKYIYSVILIHPSLLINIVTALAKENDRASVKLLIKISKNMCGIINAIGYGIILSGRKELIDEAIKEHGHALFDFRYLAQAAIEAGDFQYAMQLKPFAKIIEPVESNSESSYGSLEHALAFGATLGNHRAYAEDFLTRHYNLLLEIVPKDKQDKVEELIALYFQLQYQNYNNKLGKKGELAQAVVGAEQEYIQFIKKLGGISHRSVFFRMGSYHTFLSNILVGAAYAGHFEYAENLHKQNKMVPIDYLFSGVVKAWYPFEKYNSSNCIKATNLLKYYMNDYSFGFAQACVYKIYFDPLHVWIFQGQQLNQPSDMQVKQISFLTGLSEAQSKNLVEKLWLFLKKFRLSVKKKVLLQEYTKFEHQKLIYKNDLEIFKKQVLKPKNLDFKTEAGIVETAEDYLIPIKYEILKEHCNKYREHLHKELKKLNHCDLFLMSLPLDNKYQTSDMGHLYLYRNPGDNRVFYYIHGTSKPQYLDEMKFSADVAFTSTMNSLVECNDPQITEQALNITFQRGHTHRSNITNDIKILQTKFNKLNKMREALYNPEKEIKYRILDFSKEFYKNDTKKILSGHRDSAGAKFLIGVAVVLTGILPGLLLLATKSKYFSSRNRWSFWKSHGSCAVENVENQLKHDTTRTMRH